jgi:hypothetical protein
MARRLQSFPKAADLRCVFEKTDWIVAIDANRHLPRHSQEAAASLAARLSASRGAPGITRKTVSEGVAQ